MKRSRFLKSIVLQASGSLAAGIYPAILTILGSAGSLRASASEMARQIGQILSFLKIKPSPKSTDYVNNKKQFHLYTLLTEQRHPKTLNLSTIIRDHTENGLEMLLSVDQDISKKIEELTDNIRPLEQAVESICSAIRNNRRIYFYGCGATGRLAKQMESTFWRPFWSSLMESSLWESLKRNFPEEIRNNLIGEMTGADRALISSLEGFEDLRVIGRLQLADRGIQRGDVVFCVTEGGETSSVIGTILAALGQYGELNEEKTREAKKNLYFVYNNPDELLLPFDRSREVIGNPAITRINLTTGPQAITGSTRMQATTSETFMLGAILEEAIYCVLKVFLTDKELSDIGFDPVMTLSQRLLSFKMVKSAVDDQVIPIARLTELETETYRTGCVSDYFGKKTLMSVFIDSTERSPTFRLFPLDTVDQPYRKSWIQVLTEADNTREAWQKFLGRNFRGLEKTYYEPSFSSEIEDPYLRDAALKSLAKAGNDQEVLYDLSYSGFIERSGGPRAGDLGIILCMDEESGELNDPGSSFHKFFTLFRNKGARVAVINVDGYLTPALVSSLNPDVTVNIVFPSMHDPLGLRKQIALKMMLNAHSTAVMAKLGRVTGNTMTNVNPGNLKLIGRATYLIMCHVNDTIRREEWMARNGAAEPVNFEEVNAVLFDAMDYVAEKIPDQTAEVALSIIRIIEALKKNGYVSWEESQSILIKKGLEGYLAEN